MRMLIGSLVLILAGLASAQALPKDPASIKARCADYAKEDQVPAEELEVYLRDCVSALSEEPQVDQSPAGKAPSPDAGKD